MRTLILDADGIITDWGHAALGALNGSLPLPKKMEDILINYGMHTNQFEKLYGGRDEMVAFIKNQGQDFWRNVPVFSWANDLVKNIKKFAQIYDFELAICTSPSNWANAATPKIEQLHKLYPDIPIIVTRHKEFLAHKDALLVDDGKHNIEKFESVGGIGYLVPNPYKTPINADNLMYALEDLLVWFD
jgi:5'(3')-deoxyribonucleotidase